MKKWSKFMNRAILQLPPSLLVKYPWLKDDENEYRKKGYYHVFDHKKVTDYFRFIRKCSEHRYTTEYRQNGLLDTIDMLFADEPSLPLPAETKDGLNPFSGELGGYISDGDILFFNILNDEFYLLRYPLEKGVLTTFD